MAACAALNSLWNSIMQIQHHPRPPISLDKTRIESLIEKRCFFLEFLENMTTEIVQEAEALEGRMAEAAYAAEDLIDSHIVDQVQAASTIDDGLDKVIADFELIMNDVTEIKERMMTKVQEEDQVPTPFAGASRGSSSSSVGLDDALIQVMDKLTGQQPNRLIIPIEGMGGIGKTTLAKNVFVDPLIVDRFDIRAWATVSQEFNSKQILSEILLSLDIVGGSRELIEMSEPEIGLKLYQKLYGRRYLIVMDDMWSMEAWEKVCSFFPENNNASRILITTREGNLVFELNCPPGSNFRMRAGNYFAKVCLEKKIVRLLS